MSRDVPIEVVRILFYSIAPHDKSQALLNSNEKTLFILTKPNPKFWLASRNLENIEVTSATSLNIKQLLKTNNIILSTTGLKLINLTYGKSYT